MNSETLNTVFQRINIAVFFVIIFTPCLWMFFGPKTVFSYTEKRQLAVFPSISENVLQIQNFFSDMDSYLNDHFGFREWMVYRYQREIRKRFADVETISKVMKGENDWYFFTGDSVLEDFTGRDLRSDKELNEWIETYRAKQRWLEERKIRYLLIVPPNKITIYSKFAGEPWLGNQGMNRFTQIKNRLTDSDRSTLLDLIPSLQKANSEDTLYFRSDTHWTPYGAYLGYLAIAERIEALFPGIHFKKDFAVTPVITRKCEKNKHVCGDLTDMLLDYESFHESYRTVEDFSPCTKKLPLQFELSDLHHDREDSFFRTECKGKLKALVFRDSFSEALEPFLSENFKEVIYLWKDYDQKNVEEVLAVFKPDIVIEEKAERAL